MTRRSPSTCPVHLTRGNLRRLIDAVQQQVGAAETPQERRQWVGLQNKLVRELREWVGT